MSTSLPTDRDPADPADNAAQHAADHNAVHAYTNAHDGAADPHGDRAHAQGLVAAHEADTTSVHGIADTTVLATDAEVAAAVAAHEAAGDPHTGYLTEASATATFVATVAAPTGVAATDTAAIQAAFNAIPVTGGQVLLRAGTYAINATITLPTGRPWALRGTGMRSTRLKLANASNVPVLKYTGSVPASYTDPDNFDYLSIQDIEIDGNRANQTTGGHGLHLTSADYVVISGCLFTNAWGAGIYTDGTTDEVTISACMFANNANSNVDASIHLAGNTHDVMIVGCGIERGGGDGVYLAGAYESQIIGCNFWNNGNNCVQVATATAIDVVISGCVMEQPVSDGVNINGGGKNVVITSNRIITPGRSGIRMTDATGCVVIGNHITAAVTAGIEERLTSNNNVILGNRLNANTTNLTKVGAASLVFGNSGAAGTAVTGSRGGNAALASLLTALAGAGIITDSTTA